MCMTDSKTEFEGSCNSSRTCFFLNYFKIHHANIAFHEVISSLCSRPGSSIFMKLWC